MSTPCPSADRNLLFGLLALQMDFLSRDQLLEAMLGWMLEKQTPLGDILCRRGILADDDRTDVERWVEKHVRRHGGDPRASLAAVRVEPDVRASLAALDDADVQASVLPVTRVSMADSILAPAEPLAAREDGLANGVRYSKLRPHARGGLGEVFVAHDEELHREVALKEIQDQFADHTDSRSRFVREAEITGHLEHPGVVPVYGLGAYADGRPFYAMRFIHGESLAEAIKRFHQADQPRRDPGERRLALRDLLTRFVAVCNAVAYAHSRGVIHRDLKPANVMLGAYGETLVVDWGLARLMSQDDPEATTPAVPVRLSASSGGMATEMGQVVGTPAYMPPEQAAGKLDHLGPPSDVFALGAILYCVLTGEPPYRGKSGEVLEQARRGQVTPARQRRADVPRPLEAVCARAMTAAPKERYADARNLAEEVRRWLADEPVQAYREPLTDRVRRWGRRHRTLMSVGVALLLTGVVALGLGLWFVNAEKARTADQRDRAVEAETAANENLAQAQANLKLAREAIDECYNVSYKDPLFQGARMEKARNLLLRKTLRFYKNFRVQRPDDPALQHEEAAQWERVGYIEQLLGRTGEAREAHEKARELFGSLVQAQPDESEYQQGLARTHNNLGALLSDLGQREAALEEYQQARMMRQKLVQLRPKVSEYQQDLAVTHNNLAVLLQVQGKLEEALKEFQLSRKLRQKLFQAHPEEPEYQKDLAMLHSNLGVILNTLNRLGEAQAEYRQASELQLKLLQAQPGQPEYQYALARTRYNLGLLLSAMSQREAALAEYRQARLLQQQLIQTHPDLPKYQHDLAGTHHKLGLVLGSMNKREEAHSEYQQARLLQQKLVQEHSDLPEYQEALAGTLHDQGVLLAKSEKRESALMELQQARALRQKLVRGHPDRQDFQRALAGTLYNLGILSKDLGKHEEALMEYQQARALFQKLVEAHPDLPEYAVEFVRACFDRSTLLMQMNRDDKALADLEEGLRQVNRLRKIYPNNPVLGSMLLFALPRRGSLLMRLGRDREADAVWERVLNISPMSRRPGLRRQRAESRARAGDYLRSAVEADKLAEPRNVRPAACYFLARVYALNAGTAGKDATRPLPEREKRSEQYALAAVKLLGRAAAADFFRDPKHVEHLDADDDFAGLRGRDDYRAFRKTLLAKPETPR